MMTAKEARVQSEKNFNDRVESEFKSIENIVIATVAKGDFSVQVGDILSRTKGMLEELGYQVDRSTKNNVTTVTISWWNPEDA